MDDDRPATLKNLSISILGLGLMGGSMAMALRPSGATLLGCDPDSATLDLARRLNIVDAASVNPQEILPQADVVILAAPVNTILRLIHDLPSLHPGRAVVMDLGSTKTEILKAMQALPERFDPIGGHPVCGKEKYSLQNADEAIYHGAAFVLTPLARTTTRAKELATAIAEQVGANPVWMDSEQHDAALAYTSHLAYLVSNTLAAVTPLHVADLVGPGFRSTARLAASSPQMMIDILQTNRGHILEAVRAYQDQLRSLQNLLEHEEYSELKARLTAGSDQQRAILEYHQGVKP